MPSKKRKTKAQQALARAIEALGGVRKTAAKMGLSYQAVWQWDTVPPNRALKLERLSGVPRHELCPRVYPPRFAPLPLTPPAPRPRRPRPAPPQRDVAAPQPYTEIAAAPAS